MNTNYLRKLSPYVSSLFRRHSTVNPLPQPALFKSLLSKTLLSYPLPLKNTAIVYIHHPLLTSISVVNSLLQLGAQPKNLFILGKKYSECPAVVQELMRYGGAVSM